MIDPDIRGAYYGITPDTSAEDLTRACLEGVAFSVRQGLELIDCEVKSVSLIEEAQESLSGVRFLQMYLEKM